MYFTRGEVNYFEWLKCNNLVPKSFDIWKVYKCWSYLTNENSTCVDRCGICLGSSQGMQKCKVENEIPC